MRVTMGESLGCGCRIEIDKQSRRIEIYACSEKHAERFWMRWYAALQKEQEDG